MQLASIVTTGFHVQQETCQARAYQVAQGLLPGGGDAIPRVRLRAQFANAAGPMGVIPGLPMAPMIPARLLAPGPHVVPPAPAPQPGLGQAAPAQGPAPAAGQALGFAAPPVAGDGES